MKNIKSIKLPKIVSILLLLIAFSCNDSEQFISEATDTDGDGILNSLDEFPNDPCLPSQQTSYTGFNVFNETWATADCDGDGVSNGAEFEDKSRNPFLDEKTVDSDGDGVVDFLDEAPKDPCIPAQEAGYVGYDSSNEIWRGADCDGDSFTNINEVNSGTDPYKLCNLDFDFSNFEGELQASDSNNGENKIIASFIDGCNTISIKGDLLNIGCVNEDIEFTVFLDPFVEGGNEGNALIEKATFNCVNEAGETTEYSFRASGFFNGNDGFMEFFGYTLSVNEDSVHGNLFINQIKANTGGGGERTRCDFAGEYNTIVNVDGAENFYTGTLTQNTNNCNEYELSGDFIGLGCNNSFGIEVFFGEDSNGAEVIIGETTFSCETSEGTVEYTFKAFGRYSIAEGFIELSDFTLTDASGKVTSGTIFFDKI